MFKDEEALKCEEFLKDKGCELCKKFVEDCENGTGLYEYFSGKKPKPLKIDKTYIKQAVAIIRTFNVCKKHFNILKRDNNTRQMKGIEIKQNLELLQYRRSYL